MRVLVIEDTPALVEAVVRLIARLGHEVNHLWSTDEAWDLLRNNPAASDAVVSDNDTGGEYISGVELMRRLKANPATKELKLILMSGDTHYKGRELDKICQELGVEFVPKPFPPGTLQKLL
jgi:CheY-like chemotaxis protein